MSGKLSMTGVCGVRLSPAGDARVWEWLRGGCSAPRLRRWSREDTTVDRALMVAFQGVHPLLGPKESASMTTHSDTRFDQLLDTVDCGRIDRLTFISKALAMGVAVPAIGAALGQLPATRGVDAAAATGSITYWTLPPTSQLAWNQGEGAILKLFKKAFPQITVSVQQVPFADYSTKLATAARAGSAPDIARVNHPDVQSYVGAGWLAPLDAYIKASKVVTPKAYFPGFYAVTFVNGTQYAIPTDTDNRCLYYNKALFKRAGLVDSAGNARPPRTWAEMVQAARQISSKVKGVYPVAMATGNGGYGASYQSFGNFMVTNGGYLLSQHGKVRAQASQDSATVQAWNWFYGDLFLKAQAFVPGSVGMDVNGEMALFAHGVVAMIHDGPWARPEGLNAAMQFGRDYALAPTPVRVPSQHAAGTQGGWLMGMFKGSKNPDAAWAFLEFIQRPQINAIWCSGGSFPARYDVWELKPFVNDPFYRVFRAQLPYSRPPITPLVPQLPAVSQALDTVANKVMLGQLKPDQALQTWDAQVNAILG
jgi:multiple sugar transport system substrate-binding protein